MVAINIYIETPVFMDSFLSGVGSSSNKDSSFYKKIKLISETIDESNQNYKIIESLFSLNKIINNFSHDWQFSLEGGGLDVWGGEVLAHFPVVKVAKYAYRTKLVHAYAALA